jgi:hypothetical protein
MGISAMPPAKATRGSADASDILAAFLSARQP